jgi:hypothetical protein
MHVRLARATDRLVRWLTCLMLFLVACSGGSSTLVPPALSTSASTEPTPTEIRGCVPECSVEFQDPGVIGPGPYTTFGFLDGQLTVTYPSAWESHEDQGVEFSSAPKGKWDVHRVLFWDDILPWVADFKHPYGHKVPDIPNTAAGWLDWLQANAALRLSEPRSTTIGQMKLPATYVDIEIAPDAPNEDPYCEKLDTVCVALLSWPNAGGNIYSFGAPAVLRLYLSDVTYGGEAHLLAVAVEGQSTADLRLFLPEAKLVVASAEAPIEAA